MVQEMELNQTYEHNNPDLISALPNYLLLQILSLLNMEDVMGTSLLSRRWRYLWKSIPCLCFQRLRYFPRIEFTNFIDKCLSHHKGSKIRKLHISFTFQEKQHAPLVNSWIRLAIRRKVEDFKLHLYGGGYRTFRIHYNLPQCLYFCETLTSLTLCGCNLILPADYFQLSSLKKLTLRHLKLSSDSIERLSSSCPLLEEICLSDCNRDVDLNINITNEHVKRLKIVCQYRGNLGIVKLNAPSLLSLGISKLWLNADIRVEDLGSLMSADISCKPYFSSFYSTLRSMRGRNYLRKLLYDLRHVKHLKLCSWCIKILSVNEVQRLDTLSINATCLELEAGFTKWELPGISYLLKSCSNLENLKISSNKDWIDQILLLDKFVDKYDFEKDKYWESLEIGCHSIMRSVKTMELNASHGIIDEEFVVFLLKNTNFLESMAVKHCAA